MSLIFLFILSVSTNLLAQDTALYQKKEFIYEAAKVMPYCILYPENYDKRKKCPLILVLHGAGERGKDNAKQLMYGAQQFIADSNRKKIRPL